MKNTRTHWTRKKRGDMHFLVPWTPPCCRNFSKSTFAKCRVNTDNVLARSGRVVPSDAALLSQFPRKYIRKMQTILQLTSNILKIGLHLLQDNPTYPFVSKLPMSSRIVLQIDKIYPIFKNIARFTCVCAFFVVPLHSNWLKRTFMYYTYSVP